MFGLLSTQLLEWVENPGKIKKDTDKDQYFNIKHPFPILLVFDALLLSLNSCCHEHYNSGMAHLEV
jgi:hypothetical protein